MPLLDIKKVQKQDLQDLIDNKVSENKELEYKDYTFDNGKMSKITDKEKDKFVKEVAAFANTNGGIIIIGIQENEDRFPTKLSGAGFSIKDFDEWLSSFRQIILSRIRPHLHGVECVPIEIDEDNIAIVISVIKSYARPHSFWDGNKDEFFIRYANGITYMDIEDLRKAFLYSNSIQDKITQFRKERISMILANECVGNLGNEGKLLIHIIPEWSFELGNFVDLKKIENEDFKPISGNGWDYRYNADGYCIYGSNYQNKEIDTYTQVFHNGIMEIVEVRLISKYEDNHVFDWMQVQGIIIKTIEKYRKILEGLGVPKPWHISATLLKAKGYITDTGWMDKSLPIERDIVNSLNGICTDDIPVKEALKPVLNSLSNAFGYRESGCFEK